MSIKIASMNFGDCDTILHNTTNGMKNIAEVLGPNGEVYWNATKELTGIPPLSFTADGTPLLDYLISGNMSQSGTPTPTTPIQPQETGERTGNLFDEIYPSISGTIRYKPIYVGDGTFTLSTTTPYDSGVANIFLLSGDVSSGASTPSNGAWLNHKVTAQSDNGYVTIAYRHYTGTTSPETCITMLSVGSTPQPYEPYGYKIPISVNGQTNNIYLGNVQTTRYIKKCIFDGTENWEIRQEGTNKAFFMFLTGDSAINHQINASHYSQVTIGTTNTDIGVDVITQGHIRFRPINVSSMIVSDFKSFLAAQYAAGTPVTVWYVLATPETGIVNEPLRKIGDYADTVSYEQAGVQIPTNRGNTVIDVLTELKPSQMYIKYK